MRPMRTYEADYAGWAEDTAQAILEGRWSDIDRNSLADEVGDLAKKERRAIRSRFEVLFLHLLKQRYQPNKASRSWDLTLMEHRLKLRQLLDDNPSLATPLELSDSMAKGYSLARLRAARETGLALETFPPALPFDHAEIWAE